jgi:hypothetical protein
MHHLRSELKAESAANVRVSRELAKKDEEAEKLTRAKLNLANVELAYKLLLSR